MKQHIVTSLPRQPILIALSAIAILYGTHAYTDTTLFKPGTRCYTNWIVCDNNDVLAAYGTSGSPYTCEYSDPLGAHSKVTKLKFTVPASRLSPYGESATVSVRVNGQIVGTHVVSNWPGSPYSCATVDYVFETPENPDGLPWYTPGGLNDLQFEIVGGYGVQMRPYFIEAEVTHVAPPPTFVLDSSPLATDRVVLIHDYASGAKSYPSRYQTTDRQLQIPVRVKTEGGYMQSGQVYFRVADPPDSSAYAVGAQSNDNGGASTAVTLSPNPAPVSGGFAQTTLTVTDRYAGDNYIIQASIESALRDDPSYVCGSTCGSSMEIKAVKRAYIEIDRMFRTGAYLSEDVGPSQTPLWVAVSDARPFRNARRVRFVHAPPLTLIGPDVPYYSDVDLLSVDVKGNRLQVASLPYTFLGPEEFQGAIRPYLADGVGVITGDENTDFFIANSGYATALFQPAYVEYVEVSNDPAPFLPFEAQISGSALDDASELRSIARKWFFHAVQNNHQHVLGASERLGDAGLLGLTTARVGTNWSWIFVESVNDAAPRRNDGEWVFNGEVTAHELAHQWQVNDPANGGHCDHPAVGTNFFCTMHGSYNDFGQCAGLCPQFLDGFVGFHYQGQGVTADSEYLMIRHQNEPIPQY